MCAAFFICINNETLENGVKHNCGGCKELVYYLFLNLEYGLTRSHSKLTSWEFIKVQF